jgi:hypothetical protein
MIALVLAGSLFATEPLPQPFAGGSCPHGYLRSGNHCIPSGRGAPMAVPKIGSSCPWGWIASGNACIKSQERERP